MRVIFQTPPVPNITVRRPDGTTAKGSLSFVARLFEPGESIPPPYHAERLSQWRKTNGSPGGSVRQRFPASYEAPPGIDIAPLGIVPADVLKDLPEEALIALTWHLAYDELVPARGS